MARRSFFLLLFVLCFGLSVPALAVPGDGGGNGGGNDNGQGGGPPTTSATTTTAAATTTTAATTTPSNPNGSGNGSGNGQDGGPPTTTATTAATTTPSNGNGNGNGNGQGGGTPTTTAATATTTSNNGNGQGSGPPVTDTTVNGNGNGQGNGQGNGNGQGTTPPVRTATTAGQASVADPVAPTDDTGRVATFLAASQVPVEIDSGSALPSSEGQSAPERMISWLLTGNEQRFLPIVASPFVALMVVGRALTSAGSGAIAPVVLLAAVGFTQFLDRRRAKNLAPIAFHVRLKSVR